MSSKRRPAAPDAAAPLASVDDRRERAGGGRASSSRRRRSSSSSRCSNAACATSSPLYARIASGSAGSVLTSLLVTPLEVVKVRQQAMAFEQLQLQQRLPASGGRGGGAAVPSNVSMCPRGCGTFVLNNGQIDCLLPRSAVAFFDRRTGRLTDAARTSLLSGGGGGGTGAAAARASGSSSAAAATLPRLGAASTPLPSSPGTFALLRRIFRAEGLAGIYAGLRPTLVMAVPNTVLYFSAYDELVYRLRAAHHGGIGNDGGPAPLGAWWIPLAAGGGARLLASWATAPFEFLRTRQASLVGSGASPAAQQGLGMVGEFRTIVQSDGVGALYRGLRPTMWRDVPFSAIYWLCVERMRLLWKERRGGGPAGDEFFVTPTEQAAQAFVNGAVSGMIAACFTTPFDVLKTRQQQLQLVPSPPPGGFAEARIGPPKSPAVACSHDGAVVFEARAHSRAPAQPPSAPSTLASLRQIARAEGASALWRGNQARMLKVAPACAIMISSYELGKRILLDDRGR